jgi:hypothetical protein
MTFEQALRERLEALLRTLTAEDTSDLLIAEYSRIHADLTRLQDEREFK